MELQTPPFQLNKGTHRRAHTDAGTARVLIGFSGRAVMLFLSLRSRQAGDDG